MKIYPALRLLGCLLALPFINSTPLWGQSLYFPPSSGSDWDTSTLQEFPYDISYTDSLLDFLDKKNSKAFLVLHKGKLVKEAYFDGFHQDSSWYWASAGKSLTAFLLGQAQQDGLLNLHAPVENYLDTGWTSCTRSQEMAITPWHLMTMTSGLDEDVPDQNCTSPNCFEYKTVPGTRWYYHNGPYRATHDIIEEVANKNLNTFTFQKLGNTAGIKGLWFNHIFFSPARAAARFGLLMLANGNWDGQALINSPSYMDSMVNSSQTDNPAYGLLWWLNGKDTFKAPTVDLRFSGMLMPDAPHDLYAALGKNDQKIYVVPSKELVVVRMGEDAGQALLGPSSFDNELWQHLNRWMSVPGSITEKPFLEAKPYPNPSSGLLHLPKGIEAVAAYDTYGKQVEFEIAGDQFTTRHKGLLLLVLMDDSGKLFNSKILFH